MVLVSAVTLADWTDSNFELLKVLRSRKVLKRRL